MIDGVSQGPTAPADRLDRLDPLGHRGSLWRTVTACLLCLVTFVVAVSSLTQGYEHWTFEELRRAAAARGEMRAPQVPIRDSRGVEGLWPDAPGGNVYLVDFVYTRCPGVCQALGSEFSQLQQSLLQRLQRSDPRIRLLSLSIDPARDDTAALAEYGRRHSADPRIWRVVAPATSTANAQLLSQLGVVAVPDGFGGFVHNGDIHLIDGQGRLRQVFDYSDWPRALAAARLVAAEGTE